MYCQNCGSEIGMNDKICPYCGQASENFKVLQEKDNMIQELEQKIIKLEGLIREKSKSGNTFPRPNSFMPWIFIFPFVFMVLFFVFFIILVSI
jgi:uncharacterized membrane protein YvbJ